MSRERSSTERRKSVRPRRVRVAQLIGSRVETAAGDRVGHVIDIELVVDVGGIRIAGLELGTGAILARLHLVRPLVQRASREPTVIPWEEVERVERGRVVVRRDPRT